ncbi:MAG: DUF4388 domain-containing protein [Acidimicrobiia bacterium]|nr:DUF4388 domain-containing protein [Acidimicrobiia bacterium]
MSFQGSLDTVGLEDVFQLFSFSRKSGALRLERDEDRGAVYFHEGEVYYATTNPSEGIGKGLVNAGVIGSDDWKAVLARTRGNDVTQGKALVEQAGVDAALVEAFVRERVEDAIFKLLQWGTGDFALQEEVHPLGPVFVFASEPLLNEGRKRLEIWNEIKDRIPSTAMGVGLRRDVGEDVESVVLDRDEWRVVATLTPGVSIEDLSAALGDTEYATCRILHRMLDRDILDLHSPEKLEVIRRLMNSAQSLDMATGDDVSASQDVSDVEDAVAEVVVEQSDAPYAPDLEEPTPPSDVDGVDAAPAEAAAATVTAHVELEDAHGDVLGEGAGMDTEDPETEPRDEDGLSQKVSLADLAAAAEEGDEPEAYADPGMVHTDGPDAYAAGTEAVETAETWQHAPPQAEVSTQYEYQAPGADEMVDPHAFAAPAEHGIVEAPPPPTDPESGLGDAGEGVPEASGEGGEELDKGLILRLIAGVRSL